MICTLLNIYAVQRIVLQLLLGIGRVGRSGKKCETRRRRLTVSVGVLLVFFLFVFFVSVERLPIETQLCERMCDGTMRCARAAVTFFFGLCVAVDVSCVLCSVSLAVYVWSLCVLVPSEEACTVYYFSVKIRFKIHQDSTIVVYKNV